MAELAGNVTSEASEEFDVLKTYFETRTYPRTFTKDEKRRLRERQRSFEMRNGVLFHIGRADKVIFMNCTTLETLI